MDVVVPMAPLPAPASPPRFPERGYDGSRIVSDACTDPMLDGLRNPLRS
jgi:hypothetical protein